jgi:hypothetical protein
MRREGGVSSQTSLRRYKGIEVMAQQYFKAKACVSSNWSKRL